MIRKLLTLLALLPFAAHAEFAGYIQYGVAHSVDFCLVDYATGIEIEPTITFENADIVISQNGTEASGLAASVTDNGRCFTYALAATDTDAARVRILFEDDDDVWLPVSFEFYTFGDLNAHDKTRGAASGTAVSATPTTIRLAAATSIGDDRLNGGTVYITGGTGSGQRRRVQDWANATDDITISEAWTVDPDSTSQYIVTETYQGFVLTDASGIVTADSGDSVWGFVCEENGSRTCQQIMKAVLAEALGQCEGSADGLTWQCDDPSGTEARFTLTYPGGGDAGDRNAPSLSLN